MYVVSQDCCNGHQKVRTLVYIGLLDDTTKGVIVAFCASSVVVCQHSTTLYNCLAGFDFSLWRNTFVLFTFHLLYGFIPGAFGRSKRVLPSRSRSPQFPFRYWWLTVSASPGLRQNNDELLDRSEPSTLC
jgi:hypothetical protein